ncbi:hypothetical protein jhhlp_006407 [Lomentospora prolificans]|uniref:Uncharacterized protein n=1 Tax=Lomentospora prolificans TaxID=41688 RepID=A0A2N3N5T1_9PEZI|nr:hypothetical protein jhhlp_006407 [Lomentospora prolificans]
MAPPTVSNTSKPTSSISTHLADASLTPIITTARSQPQLEALTSLTSTALTAHSAALRLGLGSPKRLMIEYPDAGPLILSSFLEPPSARKPGVGDVVDALGELDMNAGGNGGRGRGLLEGAAASVATSDDGGDGDAEDPPMLVAVIVGSGPDYAREAKKAAAKLERTGRRFQKEWTAEEAGDRGDIDSHTLQRASHRE